MNYCCKFWISSEFNEANFGDARLTKRFKMILSEFMQRAQENISSTFEQWSEIKSCYRFLKNRRVTPERILHCHRKETLRCVSNEKQVLLLHDTVYIDYRKRSKTEGLDIINCSPIMKTPAKGLILHNSLALSSEGIPLGIFNQHFIARKEVRGTHITKNICVKKPIQDKESFRWIRSIQEFNQATLSRNVVHIADREADIYELYRDAIAIDACFLIRARLDRSINKKSRRQPPGVKLFDFFEKLDPQGDYQIKVQINSETKYREAKLKVSYSPFNLTAPPKKTALKDGGALPNLPVWGIMAREEDSSEGGDKVKWLLITNIPINNVEEAIEKIKWYSYRWNIELFHKILKSGCSVEKAQLRHAESLKNYITMKSIIAWRLFWITKSFYKNKNTSCEEVLSKLEWQILYRRFNKGREPQSIPTLEDIYYWIAKLGGYIHRKSDDPPGIISIWKGWTRFNNMLTDVKAICG
jgi:hypothetical protein